MAKILLLNSGLKNSQEFTKPFAKRLEVHLSHHVDCVDVRNTKTFDERTFFEYDQVVFIFSCTLDSIPSTTLEIFNKLEEHISRSTEIYCLIACDEYEAEKCQSSEKVVKFWCERKNLNYKGSLKIGSCLCVMKTASKFIVSSYIKKFSEAIVQHGNVDLMVTVLSEKIFMKKANQFWYKEIRKKQKEEFKNIK